MEDDDSLELSLGLACGGSSNKSKLSSSSDHSGGASRNHSNSGNYICDGVGGSLNVSDGSFNGFFTSNNDIPNHIEAEQQKHENFWTSLGNNSSTRQSVGASGPMYHELWPSPDKNKPGINIVDGNSVLGKHKMSFSDTTAQKKLNQEAILNRENEDVAESEADGPPSWLMHRTEENNYFRPTMPNERFFLANPSHLGQSSHGGRVPFYIQHASSNSNGISMMPIVDIQNSCRRNVHTIPPQHVAQMMHLSKDKQQQILHPPQLNGQNGSPLMAFGYPSSELPNFERGSWLLGPPFHNGTSSIDRSPNAQRKPPPLTPGGNLKTSHGASTVLEGRKIFDLTKENGREVVIVEEVLKHPTSQTKPGSSSSNKIVRQNDISNNQPTESNVIRPGVAPGLKFGGNGSCPDLPWVSTTGSGPNGKTISGVTYKYSKNQIRIVCACHGLHLSPEEFVLHANDASPLNVESNLGSNIASSHS